MKTKEFYRECGYEDIGYMPVPLLSEEEYPDYIEAEVLKSVDEIQKCQNEKTSTVAFMTDIHYAMNHNHTVRFKRLMRAYKEIAKRVAPDMLILGGDYTNEGCKEYKTKCFRELRALIDREPYFPVNGNHDDGSIWDKAYIHADKATNHLTHTDLYKLFYNHLPKLGAEFDEDNHSLYYMYNDCAKKVRYVFLDACDVPYILDDEGKLKYQAQWLFAMSQKQLDWLCSKALKFDDPGWSVMFITHSLLLPQEVDNPPEISKNMELLRRIVLAYKKGENYSENFGDGDFERKVDAPFNDYIRGDIIGFLVGDYHYDDVVYYDDIPLILTGNAVMYDKGEKNRVRRNGDETELLFDIVTVDKEKRKICVVRVGSGENREVKY